MPLLKPCKTTAAFEAVPRTDQALDLDALERRLAGAGWTTVANAGVMLIVAKGEETTVFASGKVLIKTMERDRAEAAWEQIRPHLGVTEEAYAA